MTRDELRQTMMVCIATLKMMNGQEPGREELRMALGEEYKAVLAEYFRSRYHVRSNSAA